MVHAYENTDIKRPLPRHPRPTNETVPDLFCWTKMGVEAGQSLESIIRRKELERQSGNGVFVWGIGNSLGGVLREVGAPSKTIPLLFSPIQSKPRPVDVNPAGLIIWLSYMDELGRIRQLPEHVLVTSRGEDNISASGKRHYALFCHSDRSLLEHQALEVSFDELRNASSGKALGFSQVTALVRHSRLDNDANVKGRKYSVPFQADLFGPYCVRLMEGVCKPGYLADQIAEVAKHASPIEWADYVRSLRKNAMNENNGSCLPLFEEYPNSDHVSYASCAA